jgi:hypothetical protein
MRELRPLDDDSRGRIEAFLTEQAGAPVRLGPIWLAAGHVGASLAAVARASGITFGGLICLDRSLARRLETETSALDALGALLVHECVHVWQYRRESAPVFLGKYLFSYFTKLYEIGSVRCAARQTAYLSIAAEREAREIERRWSER